MNYYEILGVERTAPAAEIKLAYRSLVEIHHPDRMHHLRPEVRVKAEEQLRVINEAYAVLRKPQERTRYDAALANESAPDIVFKPQGNPALARSRLEAKLSHLDEEITKAKARLVTLRPRTAGRDVLEKQWDRYFFVSVLLFFPFIFASGLVAQRVQLSPLDMTAFGLLLMLAVLSYVLVLVILLVCRLSPFVPGWGRILGVAPVVLLILEGLILLNQPHSFQLAACAIGYSSIVWEGAGRFVAASRDDVLTAVYAIGNLEQKLVDFAKERNQLLNELARI